MSPLVRILGYVGAAGALLQMMAAGAAAQQTSAIPTDAEIRKLLVERVDVHRQSVGVVVGVTTPAGHRIVTYGARAAGDARPLDGDTVFEIGSITKVFTSLLLADAVERGDVRLTDPVGAFLPKPVTVPQRNGRAITLRDLATHTSALPRMPSNFSPKDALNPYADYSVEQLYQFLAGVQLTRDIGAQYEYSNLGAGLLGHALALRLGGGDYETLVRTRILGPLGMTRTGITLSDDMRARLALGHHPSLTPTSNWDLPTLAGAGALRSTANDMLLFLEAAMGGRPSPLAPAFAAMLATREKVSDVMQVGLAWHIRSVGDTEIIWHNGGTGGYRTWMGYDPKSRSGIVVLTNAGTAAGPDDLGLHLLVRTPLLQTFPPVPPPPVTRTETSLPPSTFDRYVGRYQLAPAVIVTISRNGTRFLAQLTGQEAFDIYPETGTKFFFKIVDAQLTFDTDAQGKAVAVVVHQNGANLRAPRIEGEPVGPKEITLDAGVLDRYVGRYQLTPTVVISIRREAATLSAQLTGQGAAEIYAESERRFFYKVVNAQLTFEADAQGRTVAVVLHQNGADQRAVRIEDPKEIVLEPAVLDRYIGRYQLGPATFMTITRNGARLAGQPTGQSAQEIIATGVNTFFVIGIGAELVFEMDASGKPSALVVRQNGSDQRALRVD